jgi:hypothetical protein
MTSGCRVGKIARAIDAPASCRFNLNKLEKRWFHFETPYPLDRSLRCSAAIFKRSIKKNNIDKNYGLSDRCRNKSPNVFHDMKNQIFLMRILPVKASGTVLAV